MSRRGNSDSEDNFRVRPGAPKQRGQAFVSQVLRQASKGANSTGRKPGKAPGSRLGRGHVAARFTGQSLSATSRRATVKVRLVYLKQAGVRSTITHLRYIEREGVGREQDTGKAYGPMTDEADLPAFEERGREDRHQFRLIVSPEEAEQLDDLRTYTRHLMGRMEADLGSKLDWVAVNHWNTDNPHTHIVLRGKDDTGKDLIISQAYITRGMRERAAELSTEWLGPRTELEIQRTLLREVDQERWTSLDRTLQREAQDGLNHMDQPASDPKLRQQRVLLVGRLQRLQRVILARNLLATLRGREVDAAGGRIAAETGLAHRAVTDGEPITGVYRRSVQLASGRFAMLDDGIGFSLVPWKPVIEQRLGKTMTAVIRGSNVSWVLERQRGISMG